VKSPAFSFYVRDWLCSKTVRKLHEKQGSRGVAAYMFLLCESWLEEPCATLPADHDELAALARVSRQEWDVIWPVIECQFINDGNGRFYNPRLMEGFLQQQSHRERGAAGAAAKKQKARASQVAPVEDETAGEAEDEKSGTKRNDSWRQENRQ